MWTEDIELQKQFEGIPEETKRDFTAQEYSCLMNPDIMRDVILGRKKFNFKITELNILSTQIFINKMAEAFQKYAEEVLGSYE